MNAYQLKISVKNSKPLRWRRCIIPAGITYSQLSLLLSSLMEQSQEKPFSFEFYHAKIRFREISVEEAQELMIEETKELNRLRTQIHQPCKEVLDCRLVAKRIAKLFD